MRLFGLIRGYLGRAGDAILSSLSRLSYFWPFSWRSVGAIILGVLLAKWLWILFAPQALFTSDIPERAAGVEAGQLFGVVASAEEVVQGVALPNVQLLGVFAASAGKPGFAILKLDGNRQKGLVEGEEVAPGTILVAVNADHVLLERAGVQQKVSLENKYPETSKKSEMPQVGVSPNNLQNNATQVDVVKKLLLNQKNIQAQSKQGRGNSVAKNKGVTLGNNAALRNEQIDSVADQMTEYMENQDN